MLIQLLSLLALTPTILCQNYFDVSDGDSYILSTIQDEDKELKIDNILRNPLNYKDFPPLVSSPKKTERTLEQGHIPQYVIDYAPLVHLYSEERYLPYDIGEYVTNFHVTFENGSVYPGTEADMNLDKLSKLKHSCDLFLTSNSDFDKDPDWITGVKNKPSLINGEIKNAPATLIVVDKGFGWVDAYWFYFYSFNLGPFVMVTTWEIGNTH